LKLARTAIGVGAKLDLSTRKQSKTIIAELQEFISAEENATKTILADPFMENWTRQVYNEVLGTDLAKTVLEMAGEQQEQDALDAAVLDDPTVASNAEEPDPPAPGETTTVTQTQATEQAQNPEHRTRTNRNVQPTTVTTGRTIQAMLPPPARTNQDAQDDSTEFLEFMQLQEEAQPPGSVQQHTGADALLAALHNANATGVDINDVIDTFAEQAQDSNHTRAAEATLADNPMTRPIPKKQRYDQAFVKKARSSNPYAPRATNTNMAYFNTMFQPETKAGGVPLPGHQQAPGYGFPYHMISPSDNAQAMGFQSQGTTAYNEKNLYLRHMDFPSL